MVTLDAINGHRIVALFLLMSSLPLVSSVWPSKPTTRALDKSSAVDPWLLFPFRIIVLLTCKRLLCHTPSPRLEVFGKTVTKNGGQNSFWFERPFTVEKQGKSY